MSKETTTYEGWSVTYMVDAARFAKISGLDQETSIERFCAELERELRQKCHCAEISVGYDGRSRNGGGAEVQGPDGQYAPAGRPDDAQRLLQVINGVAARLFTETPERWAVEIEPQAA